MLDDCGLALTDIDGLIFNSIPESRECHHEQISDAIERRDPDDAKKQIGAHMKVMHMRVNLLLGGDVGQFDQASEMDTMG